MSKSEDQLRAGSDEPAASGLLSESSVEVATGPARASRIRARCSFPGTVTCEVKGENEKEWEFLWQ